jgi:hypothetical protein
LVKVIKEFLNEKGFPQNLLSGMNSMKGNKNFPAVKENIAALKISLETENMKESEIILVELESMTLGTSMQETIAEISDCLSRGEGAKAEAILSRPENQL